jgi:hypothetical protein
MRVLTGVMGLVLGFLAGGILLLANPLALVGGLAPLPREVAPPKVYRFEDFRGMDTAFADLLGMGNPASEAALKDSALAHLRIGTLVLPAGDGTPAALAVKVSAVSPQNSLWRARLGTLDYWNIAWPGEGSVFAAGYSNFWAASRDLVLAGVRGGGPEALDDHYELSALPPVNADVGVVGATGRFAGVTGSLREALVPSAGGAEWTLALETRAPPLPGQ